jgi:hypothetical protein
MAAVVGLVLLGGLAVLDWLVFRAWFDSDYLRWYLENGALIAIVFGLVTLAWGDLRRLVACRRSAPVRGESRRGCSGPARARLPGPSLVSHHAA